MVIQNFSYFISKGKSLFCQKKLEIQSQFLRIDKVSVYFFRQNKTSKKKFSYQMNSVSSGSCQQQTLNIQITEKGITLLPLNKPHKYCLIFLHGFAMPVSKFLNVFLSPEMLSLLSDFKICIPQAPKRAHGPQGKSVKRFYSWYDPDDRSTVNYIQKIAYFL